MEVDDGRGRHVFLSLYGNELRKKGMKKEMREVRRNFDVSM